MGWLPIESTLRFIKSIKFRLTIWYLLIFGALVILASVIAYFMLAHSLYQNFDESLGLRAEEVANFLSEENGNIKFVESNPGRFGEIVLLYDANSILLESSEKKMEEIIKYLVGPVTMALTGRSSFITTETAYGQQIRLYVTPIQDGEDIKGVLVIGRLTTDINSALEKLVAILIVVILGVIVLAGSGGLFLANWALGPVENITRIAQKIGESDLSKRIEIHRDDELGRLTSTLNQMIERLEKSFNRQRQFAADASHELRTPLAVIQAESSLALRKKRTEDSYVKSLAAISQEANYVSIVLDKLLTLARVDAGKEESNFEKVNLKKLIVSLALDVHKLCDEKGLQFHVNLPKDVIVEGDKIKLRQLFLNLLDNSIKYTPSGGTISMNLTIDKDMAVVDIKDTGIGINKEQIPCIFDRFYRVDKARSRGEGGAGLGLSITQHIIEVHGGRIEVKSEVGIGSTFSVLLPLVSVVSAKKR